MDKHSAVNKDVNIALVINEITLWRLFASVVILDVGICKGTSAWSLYFSISLYNFNLSAHKLEVWSSKQGTFGKDRFLTKITEMLIQSIDN